MMNSESRQLLMRITCTIWLSKTTMIKESCRKCARKIINGVRCKSCKELFTVGQIKNEAATENVWICGMCKHPYKNCPCCRDKHKKNLKS